MSGTDLPADLTASAWAEKSVTERRHLLARVIAFVQVSPAPAGTWRSPVKDRLQVTLRDQVRDADWIQAARAA